MRLPPYAPGEFELGGCDEANSISDVTPATTIQTLNTLDPPGFVAAVGHLFEHSPWVAAGTWLHRPFRDADHLHAELCSTMRKAPRERQLALICAHPDLAGRLAQQDQLTRASKGEQASAGLHQLGAGERAAFAQLNADYRARFGFPFVICARLNDRETIRGAIQSRLGNSSGQEVETALREIEKIARLRLKDAVGS